MSLAVKKSAPPLRSPTASTRRRLPFVRRRAARRSGAALPYRYDLEGGVPVMFGPDGRPDELLQFYADKRIQPPKLSGASGKRDRRAELAVHRKRALRDIGSVVDVLNAVDADVPAPHRRMLLDHIGGREVLRRFFLAQSCEVATGNGRNAGHAVQANSEAQAIALSVAVTAISGFIEIMTEAGLYVGVDPTKMDPKRTRMAPGKSRSTSRSEDGRYVVDTDRYFRIRGMGRTAPRTNNPFFLTEVMKAGKKFGWSRAVTACILAKGRTGGRDFQVRNATWFQYLVSGDGNYIAVPRKGGKRIARTQKLMVCSELSKALHQLANTTVKGGMAALKARTKSKKGRYQLSQLYIFSIDGGASPMSYSHLNDENFRPAIEMAGLNIRIYGGAAIKHRWVTMHMLRHEFTNRILDYIRDTSPNERDRLIKQVRLAHYLGWRSGEAMLRYYGAWHFDQDTDAFISAAQEAANDNTLPVAIDEVDRVAMNDNDKAVVASIAGGLIRRAA